MGAAQLSTVAPTHRLKVFEQLKFNEVLTNYFTTLNVYIFIDENKFLL